MCILDKVLCKRRVKWRDSWFSKCKRGYIRVSVILPKGSTQPFFLHKNRWLIKCLLSNQPGLSSIYFVVYGLFWRKNVGLLHAPCSALGTHLGVFENAIYTGKYFSLIGKYVVCEINIRQVCTQLRIMSCVNGIIVISHVKSSVSETYHCANIIKMTRSLVY